MTGKRTNSVHALNSVIDGALLLIRHAKPNYSFSGPYEIAPGPPLSTEGVKQAEELHNYLNEWKMERCVSSQFERARQTAMIVFRSRCRVEECEAWNEMGPQEPFQRVRERVESWLKDNMPINGKIIAVVAHGATIRAALGLFTPGPLPQVDKLGNPIEQGSVWLLRWKKGRLVDSKLLR